MRLTTLWFVVIAMECAADPASLVIVADEREFVSSHQRQDIERRGWTLRRVSIAEGLRLKYIPSANDAPAVVYGRTVVRVRDGAAVIRFASTLASGKQIFGFACARCHGEDGNSDAYPSIKKLGGIGARLSSDEIAERLRAVPLGNSEFTVRGHVLSRERMDALVTYVGGL